MRVIIGSDHAGYEYKNEIKSFLEEQNIDVVDVGTSSAESTDYPDYAHKLADLLKEDEEAFGVLICGSANGISMTANKHDHIRCAIVWSAEICELARWHNNANVIGLPARFISINQAKDYVALFLKTEFEGGRHARRVSKIANTSTC